MGYLHYRGSMDKFHNLPTRFGVISLFWHEPKFQLENAAENELHFIATTWAQYESQNFSHLHVPFQELDDDLTWFAFW